MGEHNAADAYRLSAIRQLLIAAFDPDTLRRFCQDRPLFRPVVDEFGRDYRMNDMVDRVIDYCEKQLLFRELLAEIEQVNPNQYERFCSLPSFNLDQGTQRKPLEKRGLGNQIEERRSPKRGCNISITAFVLVLILVAALIATQVAPRTTEARPLTPLPFTVTPVDTQKPISTPAPSEHTPQPKPTATPTPWPYGYSSAGGRGDCTRTWVWGYVLGASGLPEIGVQMRVGNNQGWVGDVYTDANGRYEATFDWKPVANRWFVRVFKEGQPRSMQFWWETSAGCIGPYSVQEVRIDWTHR